LQQEAEQLQAVVEDFWRLSAELHAWSRPGWQADAEYPGYIRIPLAEASDAVICMPFHLAPANPDLEILQEILKLAAKIVLGQVAGRPATICLGGSTLILKDVVQVGGLDFCEYIPASVPPSVLARALEDQIRAHDLRHCAAYARVKVPGGRDELYYVSLMPAAAFTPHELEKLVHLLEQSQNGQLFHLTQTSFAGITEATNWLIIYQPPLEDDPRSALSFAHQEAALGIYGRRPLHTLEAIATYVNFLRSEIRQHAASNPVKAYQRAIPWLRLFGAGAMVDRLNQLARQHRATQAAALLAKKKLHEKYARSANPSPQFKNLVTGLEEEIRRTTESLLGPGPEATEMLEQMVGNFGRACAASPEKLWQQIVSLADRREVK
jgi:hypothetical protein